MRPGEGRMALTMTSQQSKTFPFRTSIRRDAAFASPLPIAVGRCLMRSAETMQMNPRPETPTPNPTNSDGVPLRNNFHGSFLAPSSITGTARRGG